MATRYEAWDIIKRLVEGRIDREIMDKLIIQLKKHNREFLEVLNENINRLNRSSEFNRELLTAVIHADPAVSVLEGIGREALFIPQLYKAAATYSLLHGVPARIEPITLLKTMIVPHKYTSLYNPLVILYVHRKHPDILAKHLLSPIRSKLIIYSVNPVTVRIIVFRDLFLYASIIKDPGLAEELYRSVDPYGAIREYVEKQKPQLLVEEYSEITRAYLEVLSSTILLYRSALRAYNECIEDKSRVRSETSLKDTISGRIIDWYVSAGCTLIENTLRKTYSSLLSQTGALLEEVYGTIKKGLARILEQPEVLRGNIIEGLNQVLEAYTLKTRWKDYSSTTETLLEEIHPPSEALKVIMEITSGVEEVLEKHSVIVSEALSTDSEPYRSLWERFMKLSVETGGFPWLTRK